MKKTYMLVLKGTNWTCLESTANMLCVRVTEVHEARGVC